MSVVRTLLHIQKTWHERKENILVLNTSASVQLPQSLSHAVLMWVTGSTGLWSVCLVKSPHQDRALKIFAVCAALFSGAGHFYSAAFRSSLYSAETTLELRFTGKCQQLCECEVTSQYMTPLWTHALRLVPVSNGLPRPSSLSSINRLKRSVKWKARQRREMGLKLGKWTYLSFCFGGRSRKIMAQFLHKAMQSSQTPQICLFLHPALVSFCVIMDHRRRLLSWWRSAAVPLWYADGNNAGKITQIIQ